MKKNITLFVSFFIFSNAVFAQCNAFTTISASSGHSLGLKSDGTLWAWGYNSSSQLGNGSNTNSNIPVQIGTETNWTAISARGSHSLGLKSDGTLWAWGWNPYGQLGNGSNTDSNIPVQIGTGTNWTAISAGYAYSLGLKSDGTLWAWGYNQYGQLGNGSNTNSNIPVQIGTGTNWTAISAGYDHSLGLKSDGTLWAWGYNYYGQLGNDSKIDSNIPVQIGTGTNWTAISAGFSYYSLGLKSDGTLWAWGQNNHGQLGNGSAVADRKIPVQIGTNWITISAGGSHSLGLKSDGTLWAWGYNYYGQLGNGLNGSNTDSNIPVQIGIETNWTAISARSNHSLGLKSDGTLWAWGDNQYGQFGDGTQSGRNTPKFIYYPALSSVGETSTKDLAQGNLFINNDCSVLASLTKNGPSPVTGNVTTKVWISVLQPATYVKRHYEITPENNASIATGRVTLFFTNQEFKDFNSQNPVPALLLPDADEEPATIAARKPNLRIEKRGGTSNDNTGRPTTYSGSVETIDPNDDDIIWNPATQVWEVTFNVTGFSGFFVKTTADVLPVTFGDINAIIRGGILYVNFATLTETNNDRFIIEASADGKNFKEIGTLRSAAVGGNSGMPLQYDFSLNTNGAGIGGMLGFGLFISLCFVSKTNRKLFAGAAVICAFAFISCSKTGKELSVGSEENFYIRIAQVDKDGTKTYSKVVKAVVEQ